MIIDTSVVVEIALANEGYEKYLQAIVEAPVRLMSAVTLYESAVVLHTKNQDPNAIPALYELLAMLEVNIVPFDVSQSSLAAAAYARFGKGSHPAKLNFGDCPAYALAISKKLPLLFKGNDFAKTDVEVAAVPS